MRVITSQLPRVLLTKFFSKASLTRYYVSTFGFFFSFASRWSRSVNSILHSLFNSRYGLSVYYWICKKVHVKQHIHHCSKNCFLQWHKETNLYNKFEITFLKLSASNRKKLNWSYFTFSLKSGFRFLLSITP